MGNIKKSTFRVICLSFALMLISQVSFARQGAGKGLFKQLDLTSEQKAQLKDLRKSKTSKEDRKAARSEMKALKEKIKVGFSNGESSSTLKGYHSELKAKKSKMMDKRFEKLIKLQGILTKEQMKKYMELKKNHKRSHRK